MNQLISKKKMLTADGIALEYFPEYRKRTQKMHAIDTVLISIILNGSCRHFIDDKVYDEGPGDAGIIHYHQKHKLLPRDSMDHMNIYLDPRKIDFTLLPSSLHGPLAEILPFEEQTVHNFNRIVHFSFTDLEKVRSLLFLMEEEYRRNDGESSKLLMNYFSLVTAEIVRSMKEGRQEKKSSSPSVLPLLSWLDEHYTEQIDGKQLAAMTGWSHSWLCRTFKKQVGMTIQEYINKKRVSRAVFYILNTRETMLSIAMKVGYGDVNFFIKKFRDVTGTTPGRYRKALGIIKVIQLPDDRNL